jgi:hypothetical protein
MRPIYYSSDDGVCAICGEEFPNRIAQAEAYDPEGSDGSIICHSTCARAHGLAIEWERV